MEDIKDDEKRDLREVKRERKKQDRYQRHLNDVGWYDKNGMVDEVGKISACQSLGDAILNELSGYALSVSDSQQCRVPGVCQIWWMPTLGPDQNASGTGIRALPSINAELINIKSNITRGPNGRNITASAQEMALYFEAVLSYACLLVYCMRLVQAVNTVPNVKNDYKTQVLVRSLTPNNTDFYNSVINNKADFITWINSKVDTFNATTFLPDELSISQRRLFMTGGVYRDSGVDQGQMYVFIPEVFGKLLTTENRVEFTKFVDVFTTIDHLYAYANELETALIDSYFTKNLVSELRNVLGVDRNFTLPKCDDNAALAINDEHEVLGQILNLTTAPNTKYSIDPYDWTMYTDENGYLQQGRWDSSDEYLQTHPCTRGTYEENQLFKGTDLSVNTTFNFYTNNVTPKDWMINSRLTTYWQTTLDSRVNHYVMVPIICGTEVVTHMSMCSIKDSDITTIYRHDILTDYRLIVYSRQDPAAFNSTAGAKLTNFLFHQSLSNTMDWKPKAILRCFAEGYDAPRHYQMINWETQNLTSITNDTLFRLHKVATKSEWWIDNSAFSGAATSR